MRCISGALICVLVPAIGCGGDPGGGGGTGGDPCPAATGETTQHAAATIDAAETWAGDGTTHVVTGYQSIVAGGTLTLAACARVQVATLGGFELDGAAGNLATMLAAGTATQPVEITAQDTAWGRIDVAYYSRLDLAHTTLRAGGSDDGHGFIWAHGSDDANPDAVVALTEVRLENANSIGIEMGGGARFDTATSGLTITGSGAEAMYVSLLFIDTVPAAAISHNGEDVVVVNSAVTQLSRDATLHNPGVPYRFESNFHFGSNTANDRRTLTIEAGTVLLFGLTASFSVGAIGVDDYPATVLAQGTAAAPIRFDTDAATPQAGSWRGIDLTLAPSSVLSHVEIANAGANNLMVSANCRPVGSADNAAIVISGNTTSWVPDASLLDQVTIRDTAGHGINATWEAPSAGPDLTGGVTFTGAIGGCRQTKNRVTGGCPDNNCMVD